MLNKTTLKIFSSCVFATTFIVVALCCFIKFNHPLQIIGFSIVFSLINMYMIICVFKNQILGEEIERAKKNHLEATIKHFEVILNNLPLVAYIIDNDYNFIAGNIEACKFFNVEEDRQFKNLSIDIFERDTMQQIKEENEVIRKSKKTYIADRLVKLKNGKQNWFRVRKVPIMETQDQVNGFVIFCRNIDIERAAQRQRETYISTLSHDLKIPTIAQIRALELLVNENMGTINNEQKEILNLTLDSCYCMYDMLSTILTTYKYENNDITLNYEKIYVQNLIDIAMRKSLKLISQKNVNIIISENTKCSALFGDKQHLQKAFENLIDYCVSSAYKNSKIICEINQNIEQNHVSICISFESPYVTQETVENMFKMYTTSAEKFDKVGSSLNLYLVKQIIDAHNGNIKIERKNAYYNCYNIEIPCINECKLPAAVC